MAEGPTAQRPKAKQIHEENPTLSVNYYNSFSSALTLTRRTRTGETGKKWEEGKGRRDDEGEEKRRRKGEEETELKHGKDKRGIGLT